jgi:octaprenyl-diphosphate synthase
MENSLEKVKLQIDSFIDEINDNKSKKLFTLLTSGKMLRSKLLLKIAPNHNQTIKLCAIIEMIQSASLLHDDVIDEANTRRGKPSINAIFDNKTSIMFGDILYSKAFTKLTTMPQNIAYHISNSVTLLSVGEMMDVDMAEEFNTSYDLYLEMIYKKTSSLIEASARCGAILANKDEESFALYGKNLGIAFQMIDDILDITQDSKTLGKPAMHDFAEGKVTTAYLLLWERLNDTDKTYLKSLFKKKLDEKEILWIKSNMDKTDALKDAINLAKQYGQEAIKAIKDTDTKELEGIISQMIDRNF